MAHRSDDKHQIALVSDKKLSVFHIHQEKKTCLEKGLNKTHYGAGNREKLSQHLEEE